MACGNDGDFLADSIEELRLNLPESVGSGLIKSQLRRALIRFCIDSEIWRYAFELVNVVGDERTYQIPDMDGSAVVRVVELFAADERGRECKIPERRNVHQGVGQFWYCPEPKKVVFNEVPEEAQMLRANVVLRPAGECERFPVELYERWREALEAGALSRIFMMPKQDWTDYDQARVRVIEYQGFVSQAESVHLHVFV